jgi:hypothetical protein
VLFEEYSLHEGLGRRRRASRRLRRQLPHPAAPRRSARLDGHGPRPRRPARRAGGGAGGINKVQVIRDGVVYVPPHLSKDQDIAIHAGDVIAVSTPGGGGFGRADERPLAARERDRRPGLLLAGRVGARLRGGRAVTAAFASRPREGGVPSPAPIVCRIDPAERLVRGVPAHDRRDRRLGSHRRRAAARDLEALPVRRRPCADARDAT